MSKVVERYDIIMSGRPLQDSLLREGEEYDQDEVKLIWNTFNTLLETLAFATERNTDAIRKKFFDQFKFEEITDELISRISLLAKEHKIVLKSIEIGRGTPHPIILHDIGGHAQKFLVKNFE